MDEIVVLQRRISALLARVAELERENERLRDHNSRLLQEVDAWEQERSEE